MPRAVADGRTFYASQEIALQQLIQYLKIAERGDLAKLLKVMNLDHTVDEMKDFSKPHPNAVLFEAILLFVDMAASTGASMAGFAIEMHKRFNLRRPVSSPGVEGPTWVPPKN